MASRKSPVNVVSRFNQSIFYLALLGMLVVFHLHLQIGIDFARGPLGFGPPTMECSDCLTVTGSALGSIGGVSNIFLGIVFYLIIAGLRFGITRISPEGRPKWQNFSFLVVSVGMLYAIVLVSYQAFFLGSFCTLCMVSSAIVTLLFILHLLERKETPATKVNSRNYIIGLAAFLLLAVVDFSRYQGDSPLTGGIAGSGECVYDPDLTNFRLFDTFTADGIPFYGNPDSDVKILKFLDPNCPHCATLHHVMHEHLPLIAENARLYYQPTAIWGQSIPQVQAFYIAREAGIEPFMGMIDLQLKGQRPGGIPVDTLVAFAEQIGLDPASFRQDMESGRFVNLIQSDGRMASGAGINSVPKVIINGRGLQNTYSNWTAECLDEFIQNAGG